MPDSLDVQTSLRRGFSPGWGGVGWGTEALDSLPFLCFISWVPGSHESIQQGSGFPLAWQTDGVSRLPTLLLNEQVGLPPSLKPAEQGCIIHRELGMEDSLPGRVWKTTIGTSTVS